MILTKNGFSNMSTEIAYFRLTEIYDIHTEMLTCSDYIEVIDLYLDNFEPNDSIIFQEIFNVFNKG